ncbi:hypothetical protein [Streptomyces sp. NPDC046942]|uniref:hypothetical protein n=1 Tax=Streptomyces sp. NPDC046942 TaxID=3155137 RepID=UPI0033C9ED14
MAGQRFVVAAQQGDWTAIWCGGQEAWFDNPGGQWTIPSGDSSQSLITAKDGAASIEPPTCMGVAGRGRVGAALSAATSHVEVLMPLHVPVAAPAFYS